MNLILLSRSILTNVSAHVLTLGNTRLCRESTQREELWFCSPVFFSYIYIYIISILSNSCTSYVTSTYVLCVTFKSFSPNRCACDSKCINLRHNIGTDYLITQVNITLEWMPEDITDAVSVLVQVMAWSHQATSLYSNQCWPRSLVAYCVTRPGWVNQARRYTCSDQFRYAPSQWETSLHCNDASHWLGAYLDWSLHMVTGQSFLQVLSIEYLINVCINTGLLKHIFN